MGDCRRTRLLSSFLIGLVALPDCTTVKAATADGKEKEIRRCQIWRRVRVLGSAARLPKKPHWERKRASQIACNLRLALHVLGVAR